MTSSSYRLTVHTDRGRRALRVPDGDGYVFNGRKWWSSNAPHATCKVLIVMGKTDPLAAAHRQQSMMVVALDTPGVTVVRPLPVFGFLDRVGHAEVHFDDVRVPKTALLAGEGDGFMISQARLGPGRTSHCMRLIGMAERSLDTAGNKHARVEIAAIKVAAPAVALRVIDRAIQVHGAGGLSQDHPLAAFYDAARSLRIADGPDEVHKPTIAQVELRRIDPSWNRRA